MIKPATNRDEDYDVNKMHAWLENMVRLPQYINNFICRWIRINGILLIKYKICKSCNCNIILCEIQKLKLQPISNPKELRVGEHKNNMFEQIDRSA